MVAIRPPPLFSSFLSDFFFTIQTFDSRISLDETAYNGLNSFLNIAFTVAALLRYRSRALKNRGSYGNSTLFLQRLQYISLDFYVLRKTQNGKCSSLLRVAFKCAAMVHLTVDFVLKTKVD